MVAAVLIATELVGSWGGAPCMRRRASQSSWSWLTTQMGARSAGMTVQFVPLFFADDLQLNPAAVSLVYLCSMAATVLLSGAMQLASRRLGRIEVIIIARALGATRAPAEPTHRLQ